MEDIEGLIYKCWNQNKKCNSCDPITDSDFQNALNGIKAIKRNTTIVIVIWLIAFSYFVISEL